ncbi:MAG: DUF4382 domain-containing protein [Gemmatimonadota bacterium]
MSRCFPLSCLLVLLVLFTVGCEGSSLETRPADATIRLLLTDGPFLDDRIARVELYIVRITGAFSSAPGEFRTLAQPNRRFDMLTLQSGATAELGQATVPADLLNAVQVVINTDSCRIVLKDGRVLDGGSLPGIQWQSYDGVPAISTFVYDPMRIADGGITIVIDFDAGQSFTPVQVLDSASTDSSFIFTPWIRAVSEGSTGSISGVYQDSSGAGVAGGQVRLLMGHPGDPENTLSILATGKSDATGAFQLSYIVPSARWSPRAYSVSIDAPAGMEVGRILVENVVVLTGQVTALGTLVP